MPRLEARSTSWLSGMMPSSGIERISSTSSTFSISPRSARGRIVAGEQQVLLHPLAASRPARVLASSRPMMRSESRTEETSGLVTTTATSAWRMASVAPRSMPAGLSQMTQSNFSRSSSITRSTPSSVSASLSRVCEAGSRCSVSTPLVADQRLRQLGVALDDVDEVVDHAPLGAHDQVEVAQADVEVDDDDVLARSAPVPRPAPRSRSSCPHRPCRM